jgi:hypothetical protein
VVLAVAVMVETLVAVLLVAAQVRLILVAVLVVVMTLLTLVVQALSYLDTLQPTQLLLELA